jgi:hypothetical protein
MLCHIALAAIAATLLCACVPFPHVRQAKPDIDGVLTATGKPIAGIRVRSCAKELDLQQCERFNETLTDAMGRFHLPGESKFQGFAMLYGDPVNFYGIEVSYEGQNLSWVDGGVGYSPKNVTLQCTLSEKLVCTAKP